MYYLYLYVNIYKYIILNMVDLFLKVLHFLCFILQYVLTYVPSYFSILCENLQWRIPIVFFLIMSNTLNIFSNYNI